MNSLSFFFVLFLLLSSAVYSQDFKDYDTNNDGKIDQSEFIHTYDLGKWDSNHDGGISKQEFYHGLFNQIDRNANDGFISPIEWAKTATKLYTINIFLQRWKF